jgi:hypothetical protein
MYILYKQEPGVEILGATKVGSCLHYSVVKVAEEAIPYVDYDKLDATIITEDQFKGCRFAWTYKDYVNIKSGNQNMFSDLIFCESMEQGEKVPYYLTETDKEQAISFLKIVLIKFAHEFYNLEFDKINARTPKAERELFLTQRQEAQAWTADNTVSTPLLSALAEARGITLAEMVTKVLTKISEYEAELAGLLARQKEVETEIKQCATLKELHYAAARRLAISAFPYEWLYQADDVPVATVNL